MPQDHSGVNDIEVKCRYAEILKSTNGRNCIQSDGCKCWISR